jgi:hypothetical protein
MNATPETVAAPRPAQAQTASRAVWLRHFARTGAGQTVMALLLYVGFTVFLTWPLAAHLDSTIYISPARPEGDYTSVIAQFRELTEDWKNPFAPGEIADFNAPHGQPILWVNNAANFPSTAFFYLLAAAFGATAAFGLFTILGFVASALAMFLLVRHYTGSAALAAVIGFAYGFYPYVVANGEHPHHIHGWVFVLMAWRLMSLFEEPTVRNGAWAGGATVLALSWTPYFLLLGGVLYATMAGMALVFALWRRRVREQLVPQLAGAGLVVLYLAAVGAAASIGDDVVAIGTSSLFDVFAQTARPFNYLVPSGHNPILGDATRPFLVERGWFDHAEKSLYVGVSVALLALVGCIAALRGRLGSTNGFRAVMFGAVALVAILFSAPPKVAVLGHAVSLPSYYVWELQPGWRIYSRFVIIAMLGLCLAAAFGVAALREGRRRRVSTAILAVVAVIVPLDLWSKFEPNTRKLPSPAIYGTLRDQPPGIAAEYPIQPSTYAENYDELFNQGFHEKPIINGFPPRSQDEIDTLTLTNLSDPRTATGLADRGVRYVLLKHRKYPYSPPPGKPGRRFELISRSSFADLYRVRARQAQPGAP